MTKKELNKLTMLRALEAVLTRHAETVRTNPALAEAGEKFHTSITTILTRDNEYLQVKAGAVAAKKRAGTELISVGQQFSNSLFSLGRKTGDEQLKAACAITPTAFKYWREGELEQNCNRLLDLAKLHATELAAYNLEVSMLEAAIANFRAMSEQWQQKKAEAKAARQSLSRDFAATNDILKKDLDKLVELVKETAPVFYNEYKASQVICDYGGSRTPRNGKTATTAPVIAAETVPAEVKRAA